MPSLLGLRTAASCGSCGKPLAVDSSVPATFCRECGCCLLRVGDRAVLQPLVPPRIGGEASWLRLRGKLLDGERASLTASRLLFVPYHEWAPALGKPRAVKDARAVLAPAADLLPAGLRAIGSPLGDDLRGLAIAESARRGRLTDPADLLPLVRQGEAVDVMIPPPDRPPQGGDPNAPPRLLYYPFWSLTYRIDWKEHRGIVDAATGVPVGPSAPPRRWRPALLAALAGLAGFGVVFALASPLRSPLLQAIPATAVSWAAASLTLSRLLSLERGR